MAGEENRLDELPIGPSRAANLLLLVVVGGLLLLLIWAGFAQLDKVTRGVGRVISSKQLQVVQNLEGGIVAEILVHQGEAVEAGDILLRLDNTQFNAAFLQGRESHNALVARIARLEAELEGRAPAFDPALVAGAPGVVASEMALHQARMAEFLGELKVRRSQLDQRRQSLAEAKVAIASAEEAHQLAETEVGMLAPLVEKGIEPQIELLRARQRLAATSGDAETATLAAKRAGQAVEEAELEIQALNDRMRRDAAEDLSKAQTELRAGIEELPALKDRVSRAEVRAPIGGVVSRVLVATVGGVVQPGETLVELVPADDSLLVEAEISPTDIAFLSPRQKARVKLTAYDYSTYGALDGHIEYISPDAIENAEKHRVYLIHVRTDDKALKSDKGDLPIIPGMVAEVDILSGKRSVLDYILKPLVDVKDQALRD